MNTLILGSVRLHPRSLLFNLPKRFIFDTGFDKPVQFDHVECEISGIPGITSKVIKSKMFRIEDYIYSHLRLFDL